MCNQDQLLRGGAIGVLLTVPTFAFALEPLQRWILETGFEPDPRYAEVVAGGQPQGECGYLPSRPQLVVDYRSGDYDLGIGTEGFGLDTTLQVTTPSGDVLCDDDSGENDGDALITLDDPESGRYEIRVGTYSSEEIGTNADVFVTEIDARSFGTGFFVTDNHIVTNWHVIDGANGPVTGRALGRPEFEAEVVVYNEEDDIALLYTNDRPGSFGTVAFRAYPLASIGETVFAFGFPTDGGNFTRGEISALTGDDGDLAEFQFTAPIQPGNSGSPLFDDEGRVVGMVTSFQEGRQLANFALRGTLIRVFLDSNNVAYRLSDSGEGQPDGEIEAMARNAVVLLDVATR